MIVISGALVLVALVLLIIGVLGQDLTFVYSSIGVSLVSLVFLVVGILQRRGEPVPATAGDGAAPAKEVPSTGSAGPGTSRDAGAPKDDAATSSAPAVGEQDDSTEDDSTEVVSTEDVSTEDVSTEDVSTEDDSTPPRATPDREGTPSAPIAAASPAAPPVGEAEEDDDEGVAVPVAAAAAGDSRRVDEPPVEDPADAEPNAAGAVLVVEGRPRYHVVGCRYLAGKRPEAVDVLDAREEGFTPCGVCKPDLALAALAAEEAEVADRSSSDPQPAPAGEPSGVRGGGTTAAVPATVRRSRPATKRTTPAAAAPPAPLRAPVKRAPGRPAPGAAPATAVGSAEPGTSAVDGPGTSALAQPPAPASDASPTATPATPVRRVAAPRTAAVPPVTAPPRPGSVVVVPDRGKFHRADCRFVRGVAGTEVLSKSAATRQGHTACGTCKP